MKERARRSLQLQEEKMAALFNRADRYLAEKVGCSETQKKLLSAITGNASV